MRATRLALLAIAACIGGATPSALAEDAAPAAPAAPSAADVQKAIDAGTEWLRAKFKAGFEDRTWTDQVELVVLTLAKAGANLKDPTFAKGLTTLEAVEPRYTYRTALMAMALAEVNPRQYQGKIAHCAQWLVDTQLAGGEWGYPGLAPGPGRGPEQYRASLPPEVSAAKDAAPKDKILVKRQGSITSAMALKGDFSNTQFAVLGLRACRESGVEPPADTWKSAYGYLKRFQRGDGGWGYVIAGEQDEASYASLTAAGTCSAALCQHALGTKVVRADGVVRRGLAWLEGNADATKNAGVDRSSIVQHSPWQYYHLYSVERAGRVLGVDKLGGESWYAEGARWLLSQQQPDGHWEDENLRGGADRSTYLTVADTCFAILFLTRATRPLTGR